MNIPGGHTALWRFLGTESADAGCATTMELLDAYVEVVLAGGDAETTMPGVAAHLRSCTPCIEDFEGLLAAVREFSGRG